MNVQKEFVEQLRSKKGTSKGSGCFKCRNSCNPKVEQGAGWSYDCKLGIDNIKINSMKDVVKCEHGAPRLGFQVGGYYSHMWFDVEPEEGCLEWVICSDGDFPEDNPDAFIRFHICDFEQIETFIKFWRSELERQGLLPRQPGIT